MGSLRLDLLEIIKHIFVKYKSNFLIFNYLNFSYAYPYADSKNIHFSLSDTLLRVNCSSNTTLKDLVTGIKSYIDNAETKIFRGIHIERVFSNALRYLFEGESPHKDLKILFYHINGDFVYLKTQLGIYEREMLIEKFRDKHHFRYKTKRQDTLKEYLNDLYKKMRFIKSIEIQTRLTNYISQFTENKFVDDTVVITLNTMIRYLSSGKFKEYVVPHIALANDKAVWIQIYKFTDNKLSIDEEEFYIIHDNHFFRSFVNPFGDKQPNEFKLFNLPDDLNNVHVRTTDNETQVIEEIDYDFFKLKEHIRNYESRIYFIENLFEQTRKKHYLANYNGKWIETTINNPKIKQLLEHEKLLNSLEEA